MVVGKASIHNIMEGMESTGGVRLHNHKRKLKHRFDIIKKLGQGTYGKVQLGINKETGQEVAIKTIKKCKIETEADLIRIRREVQIMSSVQHPNIIHIYEVFENREKMVLVMEYAAGGELYDYLNERKVLTEQEARRIFRQIAIAVYYCHKHKICHRDLKLENILLDQVGNAKIADFGLSNVFDEQKLMNTFCGSPLYASPEIVKGTPYHGPEVDCWSLGVLLYTLVYGAMPFDGSNFKRLVKQISQSDYFEPKNPSPASPLIKEMLTVCPARRADIEKICTHWWVNESYSVNCLDIAEDLAAETPVRLDLPLFLVPQSTSTEKLIVDDQQPPVDIGNNMSSETLVPTRCHSVGSLMELDQNITDRRIRELIEDEPRTTAGGEAKRKLESDAAASSSQKSKEWGRRKTKADEREPKTYKSASRHHSAPIPNTVNFMLGEIMEVEPTVSVPTCKTADAHNIEDTAACLELIEECLERSPSKERSKTPVVADHEQVPMDVSMQNVEEIANANHEQSREESSPVHETAKVSGQTEGSMGVQSETLTSDKQPNNISKSDGSKEIEITDVNRVERGKSESQDAINVDSTQREFKKLKEKALSLDSDLEANDVPPKTVERRRSRIFETAEKFNQLASVTENEKPKKIFIPGVNVGGAKRVFERKASLSSSMIASPPTKVAASKVIIDVPTDKKNDKAIESPKQQEDTTESDEKVKTDEAKRRAVDIISGAIGKPPMQRKTNGSPPVSPQAQDIKKLPLKIPIGPNEVRSATVSVSTPVETKYQFEEPMAMKKVEASTTDNGQAEEPKMSSKMEITLKSATLPRPRKTSKAEISLSGVRASEPQPVAFKSEVEAKIDAFQPQKLRTQRSEIAFPVAAAVTPSARSSSLEPESKSAAMQPRERIIPIQVEGSHQAQQHSSTPPPKPPMPQRSMSQRSGSLSRQSTADSDTDSALGSTVGPEPIRKSPREYIIPIAVEGGGYVTPRSGSVEPESKSSTPTSANPPRSSRFARPRVYDRRVLSDASEDESPFSSLHRDSEDLLHRHMHRLRSSRPSRQPSEHADSLSSGEDDDDDGFELLTAENLFSRLLSRVRSLTQRLNVDDTRNADFPSSRLFARSPQAFWGLNKPLSRRLTESQFKHSLSREGDIFSRKDSANSSNPGTPNSSSSREHATPSRESVFEIGSNTLPRDKVDRNNVEAEADAEAAAAAEAEAETEASQVRKETQETLEQSFTPSLARRLSRQLIEQSRRSLARSSSVPYDNSYLDSSADDRDRYERMKERFERNSAGSSSSLAESTSRQERLRHRSPRRSISLFEAGEEVDNYYAIAPFPRQVMTLGRRYKHAPDRSRSSSLRRDNFLSYKPDKIQEESGEQGNGALHPKDISFNHETSLMGDTNSISECTSSSICNSTSNLGDTTSSVSAKSCETSPTDSTANSNVILDYKSMYKTDESRNFENRLLAAENLIKVSTLKNLAPSRFNPNLSSSYRDTEKCEKESLDAISSVALQANSSTSSKRRSCIPSLRLRSGSLNREAGVSVDRRKSFATSRDVLVPREQTSSSPEKSLLSKFFRSSASRTTMSSGNETETETESEKKEKPAAKAKQRRISRFLRPDFFDTPREESQYVKEKEAQKAAENERRKSRFIKRKSENKATQLETAEKDAKNEINALKKKDESQEPALGTAKRGDPLKSEERSEDNKKAESITPKEKMERQGSKSSFFHSLEKRLERLRPSEDSAKLLANGTLPKADAKGETARENSAPPVECSSESKDLKALKLKKTLSVEDLRLGKRLSNQNTAKSKVSSMLGLFKNSEGKQSASGNRASSTLLSKLKKSPPKYTSSKSDTVMVSDDTSSSSRIPSKYAKSDSKIAKKVSEPVKKSSERAIAESESKRSPAKEKPKDKSAAASCKERRASAEKQLSRESKKSPEKSSPLSENAPNPNLGDPSTIGTQSGKTVSPALKDKRGTNESASNAEEKKLAKTKKNASLAKSGSNLETGKREDAEKKAKKIIKPKEVQTEKTEAEPVQKKKKIVRVVKKVVKKSFDGPTVDGKQQAVEERGKPLKTVNSGKAMAKNEKHNKDSSSLDIAAAKTKGKENENDSQTSAHYSSSMPSTSISTAGNTSETVEMSSSAMIAPSEARTREKTADQEEAGKLCEAEQKTKQAAARSALKLDLSKIPQHTFRNGTVKRDSPKSDSPKASPEMKTVKGNSNENVGENLSDKLLECLSRITHRASITGNKIVIDKPLRAKDVAQLKKEVTECARIIESGIIDGIEAAQEETRASEQGSKDECPTITLLASAEKGGQVERAESPKGDAELILKSTESEEKGKDDMTASDNKSLLESTNASSTSEVRDLLSPMDEAESFDSWSLSSLEFNQARSELHSPGSPSSHSPHLGGPVSRNDQSESVIDRIRRRSFYSRFNDRRRPSLTVPPPGVTLPTATHSSATLPRKYTAKLSSYGASRNRGNHTERTIDDETLTRKKSASRERYTEFVPIASSIYVPSDTKVPIMDYSLPASSSSSSSSYAPSLHTRHLRSPTFDFSASRGRYHSADLSPELSELPTQIPCRPGSASGSGPSTTHHTSFPSETFTYATLPRKYRSTATEPKTIEYYEELLAPSNPDYLLTRKSPVLPSSEHPSRCENGYHHNGNFDLHLSSRRKSYADKVSSGELNPENDAQAVDRKRSKDERPSETKTLSAASLDSTSACTAESN